MIPLSNRSRRMPRCLARMGAGRCISVGTLRLNFRNARVLFSRRRRTDVGASRMHGQWRHSVRGVALLPRPGPRLRASRAVVLGRAQHSRPSTCRRREARTKVRAGRAAAPRQPDADSGRSGARSSACKSGATTIGRSHRSPSIVPAQANRRAASGSAHAASPQRATASPS